MEINKKELIIAMAENAFGNSELSKITGLSTNAISRARNGGSCSLKSIHKMAKALNIPVRRLIDAEKARC